MMSYSINQMWRKQMAKKESWSCNICGATTTDEEHRLITYFHMDCPGRPLTMKARKIVEKERARWTK